jgi:creatinine amidohydrolase
MLSITYFFYLYHKIILIDILLVEYIRCRPNQLEGAILEFPMAIIPFGALEWHSRHLPLGFDGLKAEILAHRLGEKLGKGVIFPTIYFGAYNTMNFPWTFHFSANYLRAQIETFVNQLYYMGFRMIIMITGHYPSTQVLHFRRVAQNFMKKHPDAFVLGIPEYLVLQDLDYIGDHAAKEETSIGLALFPELIDLNQLPAGWNYIDRAQYLGIMGRDPKTEADFQRGQLLVDCFCDRLVKVIEVTWVTKSQQPFKEIYKNADKFTKQIFSLKNIDRTLSLQGMENRAMLRGYLKWGIFKRGKMQRKK